MCWRGGQFCRGTRAGLLLLVGLVFFTPPVFAAPWVGPGDPLFRHDLQLLADAGIFSAPLQSWPVSYVDVQQALSRDPGRLSAGLAEAYARVRRRFRAQRYPGLRRGSRVSLAAEPLRYRTFQATPRERIEAASWLDWLGDRVAARLEVQAVAGPDDGDRLRFDGSVLAVTLGNWIFTAGARDRWWGPGWDGSLLLSTSARPVPGIGFQRKQAKPFRWPLLSWLGAWKLEGFAGRLESGRAVPRAKLLGLRFSCRPSRDLEIGLSRTAQWGGEGRPEDLDSFFDLLLGRDNRGSDGITAANEPGNQLGGIDWRWRAPLGKTWNYALYGQVVGEDEAGGFPSRPLGLAGVEHWGETPWGGSYRVYFEYADTRLDFYKSSPRYNSAYEHSIYRSGYRYKGRPLGHTMDNDGRSRSLGVLWATASGQLWGLHLLSARFNQDGTDRAAPGGNSLFRGDATRMYRFLVSHARNLPYGKFSAELGWRELRSDHEDEREALASMSWEMKF